MTKTKLQMTNNFQISISKHLLTENWLFEFGFL
jgi:hypothetical protein